MTNPIAVSLSFLSSLGSPTGYLATHPLVLAGLAAVAGVVLAVAVRGVYRHFCPSVEAEARARTWEDKFLAAEAGRESGLRDLEFMRSRYANAVEAFGLVAKERDAFRSESIEARANASRSALGAWIPIESFADKERECEALRDDRDALAEWYNAEWTETQRLTKELTETNNFVEELCADYEAEKSEDAGLISALKDAVDQKDKALQAVLAAGSTNTINTGSLAPQNGFTYRNPFWFTTNGAGNVGTPWYSDGHGFIAYN